MTEKDYVKFAAAIKRRLADTPEAHKHSVERLVVDIVEILAEDNSNFDYPGFWDACGF